MVIYSIRYYFQVITQRHNKIFRHQATAKHLQMFKLSIEKVTAIGIMGTSTNTFNLNDTLTREQAEKCSTNYSKDQL
ncbi:hypothetical protein ACI2WT_07080 [Lysinibacillus fusiformis]